MPLENNSLSESHPPVYLAQPQLHLDLRQRHHRLQHLLKLAGKTALRLPAVNGHGWRVRLNQHQDFQGSDREIPVPLLTHVRPPCRFAQQPRRKYSARSLWSSHHDRGTCLLILNARSSRCDNPFSLLVQDAGDHPVEPITGFGFINPVLERQPEMIGHRRPRGFQ